SIDQVGTSIEPANELLDVSVLRGGEDVVDRALQIGRTGSALLKVTGQKLDRRVAAGLADLVDGSTVVVGRSRIEAVREGAADGGHVAGAGRVEDPFALGLVDINFVDVSLELAPAGEAIGACDRELRRGELDPRVLAAQCFEVLLGLV